MRISDWSSDVCSSDLAARQGKGVGRRLLEELELPVDALRPARRGDPLADLLHARPRRLVAGHLHLAVDLLPGLGAELVGLPLVNEYELVAAGDRRLGAASGHAGRHQKDAQAACEA